MDKVKFKEFIRNKHNIILCTVLVFGIAMMFCGSSFGDKKTKEVDSSPVISMRTDEERLCEILSDIKGVGEVSVMITYYESSQKDLAYETKESENIRQNSGGHEKTIDKQAVMSDGEPMVIKETFPEVKGVVVTADGAENAKIRESIINAVQAALGVPTHRICVYEKNN